LPVLRAAGVSCFKVEGRKKSPLYVATTTDYYRKLLDGTLTPEDRAAQEADLQAVFSRPWTRLFLDSHKDKEVADRDTVGHRGALIGKVEAVRGSGAEVRIRFRARRALERHDGLQIDLPVLGKPFGFAVEHLSVLDTRRGKSHEVFEAEPGAVVEVGLPADHPPIPVGAPVYCSSSQAVKLRYRHNRPKPNLYRVRRPVDVALSLSEHELSAVGRVGPRHPAEAVIEAGQTMPGPFPPANDPAAMAAAARGAFEKLGDTGLSLGSFTFSNPSNRFVPVSRLNQLRRDLARVLEERLDQALSARVAGVLAEVCPKPAAPVRREPFRWSIKVDHAGFVDAFDPADWSAVDELVVDIARDHPAALVDKLDQAARQIGRERIRLALPAVTRKWEEHGIRLKVNKLLSQGWTRWEAANLSAWGFLDGDGLDVATDWSVYVINRAAALQLMEMGVSRFALSPEDGFENIRLMLAEFGPRAVVVVYQDTPQFIAESCAYANLIGGCPGKANCRFESMQMVSSHGERVTALDYHCRTIVLNEGPFCLSTRLPQLAGAGAVSLRADFIYRNYEPGRVRDLWRAVRAGKAVPGGHAANFDRGIL
jgi:putative protease